MRSIRSFSSPVVGSVLEGVRSAIAESIADATKGVLNSEDVELTVPPSTESGDLSFRCFELAKAMHASPTEVAIVLRENIKMSSMVSKIEVEGPYLNFYLERQRTTEDVIGDIRTRKEQYGSSEQRTGDVVMMEYVSPNTNKPLHLGHIRNALIGWSVAELIRSQGARVVKAAIINDRGIHIAKSMLAYQLWGDGRTPTSTGEKGDHFVGRYYVKFEKELQRLVKQAEADSDFHGSAKEKSGAIEERVENSDLMRSCRELLLKWESNDLQIRGLWERMNSWVYEGFNETYRALGIDFDHNYYESEISDIGREIIMEALEAGVFERADDGAIIAPLSKHPELFPLSKRKNRRQPLADKVVLRSDGTSLYITQDIALASIKASDYGLTHSIYCIANEQDFYMQQLIAIKQLLGAQAAEGLFHLSYGMVELPEGRMKSREGKVVDADDLIGEVIGLARQELTQRYPQMESLELEERARIIGLAALKFHFLVAGKDAKIRYNPQESLAFEGKTGPYILYTYTRASSILQQAEECLVEIPTTRQLQISSDYEWELVVSLLEFPDVVALAAKEGDPAILAQYLLDLAISFSAFYKHCHVLTESEFVRLSRICIVDAVRTVIGNGLQLMNIEKLEEM